MVSYKLCHTLSPGGGGGPGGSGASVTPPTGASSRTRANPPPMPWLGTETKSMYGWSLACSLPYTLWLSEWSTRGVDCPSLPGSDGAPGFEPRPRPLERPKPAAEGAAPLVMASVKYSHLAKPGRWWWWFLEALELRVRSKT